MKRSIVRIFILLLTTFASVSCGKEFKKVTVKDAKIASFSNVSLEGGTLSSDLVIDVTFDNQSGKTFSIKEGDISLYGSDGKLFVTLTTGQSDQLTPRTAETIAFKCNAVCLRPASLLLAGVASAASLLKDDMKVNANVVVKQGVFSKKVTINNITIEEIKQLFQNREEK